MTATTSRPFDSEIPRRRGRVGTCQWVGQDAWYRREVGDGTYLMVSRRRLEIPKEDRRVLGPWTYGWRWHRWWLDRHEVISSGPLWSDFGLSHHPQVPAVYPAPDGWLEAIDAADVAAEKAWFEL